MSSQVATKKPFSQFLGQSSTNKYLETVLGERKASFSTNIASIVSQDKALQECTPISVMSGAIVATTLNLSLNKSFGYAYLIPYNVKTGVILGKDDNGYNIYEKERQAQFQIGYKGYIQLAMRTATYRRLNAVAIYKNQLVSWNEMEENITLNDVEGGGEVVGYVAFFELLNGFKKTMFWRKSKMLKHADDYSGAFDVNSYKLLLDGKLKDPWKYSSFWYKDFDSMGLKTMLRQILSKYGILSEEMQKAYEYDNAVVVDEKPFYNDNPTSQPPTAKIKQQIDPMENTDDIETVPFEVK